MAPRDPFYGWINKLYACLNEIAEDPKNFLADRKWELENLEEEDQPIH